MRPADCLHAILGGNPWIVDLLDRFDAIGLPDAWIVAGAVVQTVWNDRFGLPPTHGIGDIDIVYFDTDLSAEAEAAHGERLRAMFALPVWLDVKNQARVHVWYGTRFGKPIAPYVSVPDAIASYPSTATSMGVRRVGETHEVCAPFGLADLFAGVVRPNKRLVTEAVYAAKAARWASVWPALCIIPWSAD